MLPRRSVVNRDKFILSGKALSVTRHITNVNKDILQYQGEEIKFMPT